MLFLALTDSLAPFADIVPGPLVNVNPINDLPAGSGQSLLTDEDQSVDIVLAGADADGDALTYTLLDAPAGMTIDGAGRIAWPTVL